MADMSQQEIWARVILRTWEDGDYRSRLLDDPTAVLREAGLEIPDGVRVTVLEDTPTSRHASTPWRPGDGEAVVVLPLPPAEFEQLSDESLQAVSGGTGGNGGNGGVGGLLPGSPGAVGAVGSAVMWPLSGAGGNGGVGGLLP